MHQGGLDVDEALAAEARRADGDGIFIDDAGAGAGLRDGAEHRARERHEIAQLVAQQHVAAGLEVILRRDIGEADALCPRRSRSADWAAHRPRPWPAGPRRGVRGLFSGDGIHAAALSCTVVVELRKPRPDGGIVIGAQQGGAPVGGLFGVQAGCARRAGRWPSRCACARCGCRGGAPWWERMRS